MDLRFAICDLRLDAAICSPSRRVSTRLSSSQAASPRLPNRRGFSFVEILFAVMILGIGFIMVAAIFPVAIQQTEANNQETISASIGRVGTDILEKVAQGQAMYLNPVVPAMNPASSILVPTFSAVNQPSNRSTFAYAQQTAQAYFLSTSAANPQPVTVAVPGEVWSFLDPRDDYRAQLSSGSPPAPTTTIASHAALLWNGIAHNLVVPSDPRFGYVLMYKRDYIAHRGTGSAGLTFELAPYAQVIVIAVEARNKQVYSVYGNSADVVIPPGGYVRPTLVPVPFGSVTFTRSNTGVTTLAFGTNANSAVAENAYVVVSDDQFPVGDARHVFNGRIFRVGNPVNANSGTWELAPGNDLTQADAQLLSGRPLVADVLVVGRAADPSDPKQFTGLSQAVSAYTTYVQVP